MRDRIIGKLLFTALGRRQESIKDRVATSWWFHLLEKTLRRLQSALCGFISNRMKLLKYNLVLRGFAYSVALFYGSVFIVAVIWGFLRHPRKKFWRVKRRIVPPECLTDPARGDHCYAQLKNIKLHYVEKGDKSKPLIVFVHGFPEFWYSWRHQMEEFSKDYWTVALDMRGYGDSDKPEGVMNYAMKYLVGDIKELVEYLGRDTFTLVAHDWGGAVAWTFLEKHPDMVERYVIMDAPRMASWKKLLLTSWKQFSMSWYVFFYQLPYLPELAFRANDLGSLPRVFRGDTPKEQSLVTDEDIEAYKFTFGKSGALTAPINYYRANLFKTQKILKESKRKLDLKIPGLFIFGEQDKFISMEFVKRIKDDISNLTVKIVAGGNHFVQQDKPKTVNKLMTEFFEKKIKANN